MNSTPAALVLAGGLSSRMGQEKATMEIESRTMIQWAYNTANKFADHVYISVHDEQTATRFRHILPSRATFIIDVENGPRSVLLALISAFPTIEEGRIAVMPVDSPFMAREVMAYMTARAEGFDLAIPMWPDGRLEAIHAIYDRDAVLPILHSLWTKKKLELREIPKHSRRTLFISTEDLSEHDPTLLSLLDADTPDEFASLKAARRTKHLSQPD